MALQSKITQYSRKDKQMDMIITLFSQHAQTSFQGSSLLVYSHNKAVGQEYLAQGHLVGFMLEWAFGAWMGLSPPPYNTLTTTEYWFSCKKGEERSPDHKVEMA